MKRVGLVLLIVALIGALCYINAGMNKSAQLDADQQTQQPATKPKPVAPSKSLVEIPPEQVLGNPAHSVNKILIGWDYSGAGPPDPNALLAIADAVKVFVTAHPDTSAVIADIDVPVSDRSAEARAVQSLGVSVNGKPIPGFTANPESGLLPPGRVFGALQSLVH